MGVLPHVRHSLTAKDPPPRLQGSGTLRPDSQTRHAKIVSNSSTNNDSVYQLNVFYFLESWSLTRVGKRRLAPP